MSRRVHPEGGKLSTPLPDPRNCQTPALALIRNGARGSGLCGRCRSHPAPPSSARQP
ncbi:hypothetical protein UO65_1076 [Actinokineospora spheciospongiae]|uniref:Uncharacterized protein n=1 Tax=Actinokineospora spheciospongiae TaxID=909613 RepID=W7J3K1_9PSEU|nr:hypothetical protein UO65_1076 [Actinokineospora spheciospongiae]